MKKLKLNNMAAKKAVLILYGSLVMLCGGKGKAQAQEGFKHTHNIGLSTGFAANEKHGNGIVSSIDYSLDIAADSDISTAASFPVSLGYAKTSKGVKNNSEQLFARAGLTTGFKYKQIKILAGPEFGYRLTNSKNNNHNLDVGLVAYASYAPNNKVEIFLKGEHGTGVNFNRKINAVYLNSLHSLYSLSVGMKMKLGR